MRRYAGEGLTAALEDTADAHKHLEVLEHMSRDVPWGDEIIKHDFEVKNGTIEVPDKPDRGVEFDAEAAKQYPGEPKDSHSLFDAEGALKRP